MQMDVQAVNYNTWKKAREMFPDAVANKEKIIIKSTDTKSPSKETIIESTVTKSPVVQAEVEKAASADSFENETESIELVDP